MAKFHAISSLPTGQGLGAAVSKSLSSDNSAILSGLIDRKLDSKNSPRDVIGCPNLRKSADVTLFLL